MDLRKVASRVVLLLLFLPASASIATAQWNIHLIGRLRGMKRMAPDTELDLTYRKLLAFLPPRGEIGYQSLDTSDDGRLFYRAQYALAPHQMRKTTDQEFVIEVGPVHGPGALSENTRFQLVTSVHESLRLFRKVHR
jgi:hypothetical protein